MAEKPILFSTEMVKAILEGRKSVTRRVVKPQPPHHTFSRRKGGHGCNVEVANGYYMSPPWQPGDRLWVRETWRDRWGMAYANYGSGDAYPIDEVREIEYKAGGNGFFVHGVNLCPDEPTVKWGEWSNWKPSIHMPKEAARLFLRVTDVRVEPLQDITEKDAIDEGVQPEVEGPVLCFRCGFIKLWNSIYAKRGYGWDENNWVWVVSFEIAKS